MRRKARSMAVMTLTCFGFAVFTLAHPYSGANEIAVAGVVPEPASMLLLGSVLGSATILVRRLRKDKAKR
jgi:hypothetical protein